MPLTDAQVQAYLRRETRALYAIDPREFLKLTVESPEVFGKIITNPPSQSREARDPPILIVRPGSRTTLEILGHDGRHRAWASYLRGARFPVRIVCKTPFSGLPIHLQGQFHKGLFVPVDLRFYQPLSIPG